jgi:hypothetical protein
MNELVAGPGLEPGEGLCDFCEDLAPIAVRGSGLSACYDCAALAEEGS